MISESTSRDHIVVHPEVMDKRMTGESIEQRIENRVKKALVPTRFPERRDVELAFATNSPAGSVEFIDHFWLGASQLWIVAAQLAEPGLDGALRAAALRQLLRALAAELEEPEEIVAYLTSQANQKISGLAVLRVDASSGDVRHYATGLARCAAPAVAAAGEVFWLSIGSGNVPRERRLPVEGLQALVERSLAGDHSVLAAVQFKAPTKRGKSLTLTIQNDRSGIPDALSSAKAFLEGHRVPDHVVGAFELSLDEILTNQINYGFRDGAAHEILVELRLEGDFVRVELRDDGVPFDPLGVAEPDLDAAIEERQLGGLGMHFVRTLVDEASYRRDGGWNVLSLGKYIKDAAEVQA